MSSVFLDSPGFIFFDIETQYGVNVCVSFLMSVFPGLVQLVSKTVTVFQPVTHAL